MKPAIEYLMNTTDVLKYTNEGYELVEWMKINFLLCDDNVEGEWKRLFDGLKLKIEWDEMQRLESAGFNNAYQSISRSYGASSCLELH